ncbi:MAG: transglutaminase domain-containing protein, partial [Desulfurococcaceae archaeon]
SMCRAVGIPSFLQLGCIYKPGDAWQEIVMHQGNYVYRSKGIGWHAWSMVYIPSVEWIPVDLTYFNDAQLTSKTGEPLVYIKSPGGVKAKIEGAALLTVRPLIYANYSSLRYVDDVRAWEKAIAEGRLRYLQSEELKLMAYGGISRLPIPLSVPLAACAAFTALLLVVYLRLKIKRKTT